MAVLGNRIVLTPDRGYPVEGILGAQVGATAILYYPGMIVQWDSSIALQGGRGTWTLYNADADGGRPKGPQIVLCEDLGQGSTVDTELTVGARVKGFVPLRGCRLNLRWRDTDTGTSTNDLAIGTIGIIQDGTGMIIATTGSPEEEVCQLTEAITNLAGASSGGATGVLGQSIWQC